MQKKGKLAPLLLCLFLGNLGIHDFIVGKTALGVVHLLMLFASIWFIVFGPIAFHNGAVIGYILFGANALLTLIEFFVILLSPTYGDREGW